MSHAPENMNPPLTEAKTGDVPALALAPCSGPDVVNHPPHYTSHPSGVECIEVTEHYGFCIGNAIKYLWRAGLKGDAVEDLKKAVWYVNREIARREGPNTGGEPRSANAPVPQ